MVSLKFASPTWPDEGLTETSWIVNGLVGSEVTLTVLLVALIVLKSVPGVPVAFMIENCMMQPLPSRMSALDDPNVSVPGTDELAKPATGSEPLPPTIV